MNLYLIRHAEAMQTERGGSDEYRPLTESGRLDAKRLASVCNMLGITFDRIWSSPLRRADDTATLLGENLEGSPRLELNDALGIPGNFNGLRQALRKTAPAANIALVGHMPFLGECLQYWVGGVAHPGIHIAKSSIVCLSGNGFNCGEMVVSYILNKKLVKAILDGMTE